MSLISGVMIMTMRYMPYKYYPYLRNERFIKKNKN